MAAINDLEDGFARVHGLITLHRTLTRRQGRPPRHASDVLRATIVMAVATLDAFVRDLISEQMPKVMKSPGAHANVVAYLEHDGGLKKIAGATDPQGRRLELFRQRLSVESAQEPQAINKLVRLTGLDPAEMWSRIEVQLASQPYFSSSVPQERLGKIVDRRHQIAHRNDVPEGATKAEAIRRAWVEYDVEFLLRLGRAIDHELTEHVAQL